MTIDNRVVYEIKNLTKIFESEKKNKVEALKNISFKVKEGELVVIVGPSGCGKSTLLRILAHMIKPTNGSIVFHHEKNKQRNKSLDFGFVFQNSTLMPWRTVIENIILPLEIIGEDKNKSHEKAKKLLKMLDLVGFENFYPSNLSGGMKQKVEIARALVHNPIVLLMDEPFSALDETLRQKLNFELLNIKKKTKKTIVFVTHSISEAIILADRVIVMGRQPNSIKGTIKINLLERTLETLNSEQFFKEVVKIRKLMGD